MKNPITTKEIVKNFYDAKSRKSGWQSMVTDRVTFKGTGMPSTEGKEALIEITEDLLTRLKSAEMKRIIVEGDTALVLNNYHLESPKGNSLILETAEIVGVKNGKMDSFDVYFDTAAFQSFIAKLKQ